MLHYWSMLTNIYCHACCPGQLNLRDLYCICVYSVFSVFVSLVQLSCGWRRVDEMLDAAVTVKVTLGLVFWKQSPFT